MASPHVDEARLLEWNQGDSRGVLGLFAIDGDRTEFEAELAGVPELVHADVTTAGDGRFYLLVVLRPSEAPLADRMFENLTRDGLVVLKPVIYRDGQVHARLVGSSSAVQAAVETVPPAVDVTVEAIGQRGFDPETAASALSDRQREAVLVAIDLGYYDVPRRATHEDVAERLGCAPSTASEHLQKAEAKLVRGLMSRVATR